MSKVTPFFCIDVSSSLTVSSNVNPYWKPEQPPPVTNTRSLRSGLPSSSISVLTFVAAASVNTNGAGISVIAFIICSGSLLLFNVSLSAASSIRSIRAGLAPVRLFAGCALQFHHIGGLLADMHQLALDNGADVHFERSVHHVSMDLCLGLQFQMVAGRDRAGDRAVDDHVRDTDFAFDPRTLADHQRPGLIVDRRHFPVHDAVDAQPPGKNQVTIDRRTGADQAVQPLLCRTGLPL